MTFQQLLMDVKKIVDEYGNTYYGVYYGNTEGKKNLLLIR